LIDTITVQQHWMNPPGGAPILFDQISYIDRCEQYLSPQKIRPSGDVKFDSLLILRLAHQKKNEELLKGETRNTDTVNWWTDISLDSLYPIGK